MTEPPDPKSTHTRTEDSDSSTGRNNVSSADSSDRKDAGEVEQQSNSLSFHDFLLQATLPLASKVRLSDKGLIKTTPDSWFVKIVYTLFLCSNYFDDRFLGYSPLTDRFDVSKELIADAQCNGVQVNVIVYNNFLNISIKHTGKVDEAFELLSDMRSFGCSPDIVIYNTLLLSKMKEALIDGYCRVGWVNAHVPANLYTFSVLISALCKSNSLKETHNLLRLLKQSDIVPVFSEMEEKCKPETFTILIIGHCMKGRTPEAIGIFYKMLEAGSTSDDVI
ncbi:unnamed protein product [Sphenostylis stenocarpa]|uniref:Pentatricopeptide repeat-containing protein n=1 Tax=Sphenostylis stenocarpa TaxID=92480 RepID=A0AA86V807_9FABA|nr:unnamed protein product [Sphenostylis stenocarpa]